MDEEESDDNNDDKLIVIEAVYDVDDTIPAMVVQIAKVDIIVEAITQHAQRECKYCQYLVAVAMVKKEPLLE